MRDSICNDCVKRTRCDMAEIGRSPLAISACYGYEKGNPTNADRIRAMTDEELAVMFAQRIECMYCPLDIIRECRDERTFNGCKKHWLDWLKAPVEASE